MVSDLEAVESLQLVRDFIVQSMIFKSKNKKVHQSVFQLWIVSISTSGVYLQGLNSLTYARDMKT